ncbi:hypothetical protein X805_14760 [Sphaerotilus natans subsp. natans DSM 6575]|uniref:Uncharacterized protein n=1 Tax=Sphaerotilus natans subsp. natans DSM 6575 TaxID=1286631 RepID=A0A059KP91_9BURK|nr:hypothetical protein [Sphaerotilus natans]KDB52933.1 hypothetical protein X805_14760 [Sphaerotilus natans subsp. natans DSM 6575]
MFDQTVPTLTHDLPPEVLAIVNDDAASAWLKKNLWHSILHRDPVDAASDAEALAGALQAWTRHVFQLHGVVLPSTR